MSDAEEAKRKCLCGVVVDYNKVKCEGCGGKKHPILCDECFEAEFEKATKAAPFRIRAVLTMMDAGPLGDNYADTFPTCLRYDADWYEDVPVETQTLRIAVEMLKEGLGYTFTSLDRSIIMKAFTKVKTGGNDKGLLAEFFPLMKPYLGWMEADEHERANEENGEKEGDAEEDKASAPESKRPKH